MCRYYWCGSATSRAICKSAPRSRQITTPAPRDSFSYRLDDLPAAQPTASKHWRHITIAHCYCFYFNAYKLWWWHRCGIWGRVRPTSHWRVMRKASTASTTTTAVTNRTWSLVPTTASSRSGTTRCCVVHYCCCCVQISMLSSSALTLLVGWQEGHPVCKKTGAGVVICLDRGADLHMAQLMPVLLTVCVSRTHLFHRSFPLWPSVPIVF